MRRASPHAARRKRQLRLPVFPTTTIGSFPQTAEVRAARKKLHDGKLTPQEYDAFIADQIARTLKLQEELGLDVLVHGEFERNDIVERSEEHTSELQSPCNLVCRLLLEKKKKKKINIMLSADIMNNV